MLIAPRAARPITITKLVKRLRCGTLEAGIDEIAKGVTGMVAIFDDPTLLVTSIDAKLGEQVLQIVENLETPRAEPLPHSVNAALNAIISGHEIQAQLLPRPDASCG